MTAPPVRQRFLPPVPGMRHDNEFDWFAQHRLVGGIDDSDEDSDEKFPVDENVPQQNNNVPPQNKKQQAQEKTNRLIRRRRRIASMWQTGNIKVREIVAMNYTPKEVRRWKNVPVDALDAAFMNKPRGGRAMFCNTPMKLQTLWDIIESDEPLAIQRAMNHFKVTRNAIYTTLRRTGKKHRVGEELRLRADHLPKRRAYSLSQMETGAEPGGYDKYVWADHTVLSVPPEPEKYFVWRREGSAKPIPSSIRDKNKTRIMMWVAIGKNGVSPPWFNVTRRRRKKRRRGEVELGWMHETFSIDEGVTKETLLTETFPWMRKHGYDTIVMDNASVQDGLTAWINENGMFTPGFASARRNERNGYPPNSPDLMWLDAAFFNRFKILYARANPQDIRHAVRAARQIVHDMKKDMAGCGVSWFNHLDDLYKEIVDCDGGASHLLKSGS